MLNHLIVVATLEMAHAILLEAALSFLGLGVQPPTPSWGLMISEAKGLMFFDPWLITIPGVALFALVLAINMLGDGLRDVTAPENRGAEAWRCIVTDRLGEGGSGGMSGTLWEGMGCAMNERILTVEDLRVDLPVPAGTLHAVQGVSFHVDRGETVCIVGESGCGKSLTALAIMDLLPTRAQRTRQAPGARRPRHARTSSRTRRCPTSAATRMAMIFQEPMTSLNPAYTIGNQLEEALLRHKRVSRRQARERAVYLLERVGITAAGEPPQAVSAPALRRPAPARDDRHGADVRARR